MNYSIDITEIKPGGRSTHLFRVDTGTVTPESAKSTVKLLVDAFPRSKGFQLEVIQWTTTGTLLDPLSFINQVS